MIIPKHFSIFFLLLLGATLFCAPPVCRAATEPGQYTLGDARLFLRGPEEHPWINKKGYAPLLLVPERYKGLTKQLLALYSSGSVNSLAKLYNNHGALFFMGSAKKVWDKDEFARLKSRLMPAKEELSKDELEQRAQFLRQFLGENANFALSSRKARKYYGRLRQATVEHDAGDAVILAYRHKKKKEKDKYVVISLSLVRGKLIGTAYYQVDPNRKERERAVELTRAWQNAILQDNH